MATRPLPTIDNDKQQGRLNQEMLDVQKVQLDVLSDILGGIKSIAVNLIRFYAAFQKSQGVHINVLKFISEMNKAMQKEQDETKNKLAEKEKERESGLGGAPKKEGMFDGLKKLFEDYFGIFRTVFTIIKTILIPMVLGFVVGFRKKFDLLSVAITLAILFPIRTFKLMVKVFGFLFEALKGVGRLISKIGPEFKNAVEGITNFFRRMRVFFLRTLDLGKILQPIRALFSSGSGIFQVLAKGIGKLFSVLKVLGRFFGLPLTILMGIIGGIQGALEGFKKEGLIGGLKGLISGAFEGAFGWIFDAIGWVFGALGFEEGEKALEEFSLGTIISNFLENFIIAPIRKMFETAFEGFGKGEILSTIGTLLLQFADNLIAFPKFLLEALAGILGLDGVAKAIKDFSFEDKFTKVLRAILIAIGEAIPGGEWLLSKLGIKKDEGKAQGKKAAPTMAMDEETKKKYDAIDTGNEQVDNLARAALESGDTALYEDLTGQGAFDLVEDTEDAKKLMAERGYNEQQIENIAQTGYIRSTPQAVPVPPPNKAEQLDEATKEANKAKKPEPVKPVVTNTTVIDASNNSKTTASMNSELHAGREGIGSRGNAGFSNFVKPFF